MRATTLFNRLLPLQGLSIRGFRFEGGSLVLEAHRTFRLLCCPRCGATRRGRESAHLRSWRHWSVWGQEIVIEAEIRRFRCRPCDAVVTEAVPWARHDSAFTTQFEDAVALLAQQTNRTAVAALTGVAWATVGNITERVVGEHLDPRRLDNLTRIAVDEVSYRKHHRYLTVVTDHVTRRVVWIAEGKSSETLGSFFDLLGKEACERIVLVTMDMSAAYIQAVTEKLKNAKIAFDHFHIVKLANEALDKVRRGLVREAEGDDKKALKGTRWALLHRMDNVPEKYHPVLEMLTPDSPLGRAYLLKESLLDILRDREATGREPLDGWLAWAARSKLSSFVTLGQTLRSHMDGTLTFMKERLTNGLAEGMNNKIRVLTHRAYGFHSAASLVATIFLCCAGITLPHLQLL